MYTRTYLFHQAQTTFKAKKKIPIFITFLKISSRLFFTAKQKKKLDKIKQPNNLLDKG
jgi:hypothetical protein